jgi:hypothetical protein
MPANSNLAALEISLAGLIGREMVLRQYVEKAKPLYPHFQRRDCGRRRRRPPDPAPKKQKRLI